MDKTDHIYSNSSVIYNTNNEVCITHQVLRPVLVNQANINELKEKLGNDITEGQTVLVKEDLISVYMSHQHAKNMLEALRISLGKKKTPELNAPEKVTEDGGANE